MSPNHADAEASISWCDEYGVIRKLVSPIDVDHFHWTAREYMDDLNRATSHIKYYERV
jgi:hypothetical protein